MTYEIIMESIVRMAGLRRSRWMSLNSLACRRDLDVGFDQAR